MSARDTVYDLAKRTNEELWDRVLRTFERWPSLRSIYTDESIDRLIRLRKRNNNRLLLRLTLPDEVENWPFWDEIERNLKMLGPQAAKFGEAMRNSDPIRHEGWRTELWFAAWIHEQTGAAIEIEPPVGASNADFCALTSPELWFEVKSPQDAISARAFDPIDDEFRRRILAMPEKFRIDMDYTDDYGGLHVNTVSEIVKRLRAQLALANGTGPVRFESLGIRFRALPDEDGPCIGIVQEPNIDIGDAYTEIAYDKICEAVKQLPAEQAGIVVIDRTNGSWMSDRHVLEACFGKTSVVTEGLRAERQQLRGGAFQAGKNTRISAVISYSRRFVKYGSKTGRDILVIHNPDANIKVPHAMLDFTDVRQTVFNKRGGALTYTIQP